MQITETLPPNVLITKVLKTLDQKKKVLVFTNSNYGDEHSTFVKDVTQLIKPKHKGYFCLINIFRMGILRGKNIDTLVWDCNYLI